MRYRHDEFVMNANQNAFFQVRIRSASNCDRWPGLTYSFLSSGAQADTSGLNIRTCVPGILVLNII
jgi:hypothetical protein